MQGVQKGPGTGQGKLTGCKRDLAIILPRCFRLLFFRASNISRSRGAVNFKLIREITRNSQKHTKSCEIR